MITKKLLDDQLQSAYERGYERGYRIGSEQTIVKEVTPESEDYDELVRKAGRYDALLNLYQQQLVRAVWYQDEILRYEKSR